MPELPDIALYTTSLDRLLTGKQLQRVVLKSPFLVRTFEPPIEEVEGLTLSGFSHIAKRIVWHFENDLRLVFHLMIAGRFHFKKPGRLPSAKNDLIAFQFDHGTILVTEASKKKRASLHVVAPSDSLAPFHRGGLDPLTCKRSEFQSRLLQENRTLKRALTDQTKFSGIGNAYSDEILLNAKLSPLKRTQQLTEEELERLFLAVRNTLSEWIHRLQVQSGDQFPKKVTAFRKEMGVHGKFNQPCPVCQTPVQRICYAENECNYCPKCQTNGRLLADRSLSRLLRDEWPKKIDEDE